MFNKSNMNSQRHPTQFFHQNSPDCIKKTSALRKKTLRTPHKDFHLIASSHITDSSFDGNTMRRTGTIRAVTLKNKVINLNHIFCIMPMDKEENRAGIVS